MSCKYKKSDEPRFCQIIQGYCQFQLKDYDDKCPILNNYKNFDIYLKNNSDLNDENTNT